MKIVDRYHMNLFAKEFLRLLMYLSIFILFYALIRIQLRHEPLVPSYLLLLILYSFAEIMPFMTALALFSTHQQMLKTREYHLVQMYAPHKLQQAWRLWPILLPLSLFCALYIYILKPNISNHLRGELKVLHTQTNRPQALAEGWLWRDQELLWMKMKNKKTWILSAQNGEDIDNHLSMQQGSLKIIQDDQNLSLRFNSAQWPLGFNEGPRQFQLPELIHFHAWQEFFHRLNLPLLIFVLAGVVHFSKQLKPIKASILLGLCIISYTLFFYIIRPLHLPSAWSFMAICPSLLCTIPCFFFKKQFCLL